VELLAVAGIRLGVTCAGIKYPNRRDLVVIEAAAGTRAAAVFTRNAFRAAPVTVARAHLAAYFRFYNEERPHQARGYRTPHEAYFGSAAAMALAAEAVV